jgi:hypothetical protein
MRLINRLMILALLSPIIQASIQHAGGHEGGFADRPDAALTQSQGKISILSFDARSLNAEIRYQGKIVNGARWIDSNGENILVMTQTGNFPTKGKKYEEGELICYDAEVYAYHYVIKAGKVSLLWKITDFKRDCPFDLYAGFLKEALFITDLDSDGIAESSFLYKLSCRSDVSPDRLKLIMHEGATKYAIRGTTRIEVQEVGGEMNIDPAFNQANPVFKKFAVEKWKKYVTKWEIEQF